MIAMYYIQHHFQQSINSIERTTFNTPSIVLLHKTKITFTSINSFIITFTFALSTLVSTLIYNIIVSIFFKKTKRKKEKPKKEKQNKSKTTKGTNGCQKDDCVNVKVGEGDGGEEKAQLHIRRYDIDLVFALCETFPINEPFHVWLYLAHEQTIMWR